MTVLKYLQARGWKPAARSQHKGGRLDGPCPMCGGRDRFKVYTAPDQGQGRGTWWCSAEDVGGDLEALVMLMEGCDFPEACARTGRQLKHGAARPRPATGPRSPRLPEAEAQDGPYQPHEPYLPNDLWREKAGAFVDWAHERLLRMPEQLAWLAARGIPAGAVAAFRLGWNPGEDGRDVYRDRGVWGLPPALNQDTGKPRRLWLPRGLVIPNLRDGALARVRIRRTAEQCAADGAGKYIVLPCGPDSVNKSMALVLRPEARAFLVVEAELDAMALAWAAGDLAGACAVTSLEAKPDAAAWADLTRTAVLFVGDALDYEPQAANPANARAHAWWQQHCPRCRRTPVPQGKDPGDFVRDHAGDLRAWVWGLLPPALQVAHRAAQSAPAPDHCPGPGPCSSGLPLGGAAVSASGPAPAVEPPAGGSTSAPAQARDGRTWREREKAEVLEAQLATVRANLARVLRRCRWATAEVSGQRIGARCLATRCRDNHTPDGCPVVSAAGMIVNDEEFGALREWIAEQKEGRWRP